MYLIKQIAHFCIQMMSMIKKEMKDHKLLSGVAKKNTRHIVYAWQLRCIRMTAAMHSHDSCDAFTWQLRCIYMTTAMHKRHRTFWRWNGNCDAIKWQLRCDRMAITMRSNGNYDEFESQLRWDLMATAMRHAHSDKNRKPPDRGLIPCSEKYDMR